MDVHIIDDDQETRLVLGNLMHHLNYRSKAFSDAAGYLDYMNVDGYSPPGLAIISDVDMPGMSGFELLHVLRQERPDQRFVIITGGVERRGLADEYACFYLTKPICMDKLNAVLTALSRCSNSGPYPECYACAPVDDRHDFDVIDWHCPLRAN